MAGLIPMLRSVLRDNTVVNIEMPNRFTNDVQHRPIRPPTEYQCLKLCKEFEDIPVTELVNGKSQDVFKRCLKKATGLEPYNTDVTLEQGVLRNLIGCEFLICIAMYNEGPYDVLKTLSGVVKNVTLFKRAGVSPNKIVCMMICDGLIPFLQTYSKSPEFYKQFVDIEQIKRHYGVDNEKDIKQLADLGDNEIAHCFKVNTTMGDDSEEAMQLIWVIKHANKRKLNTHLWFFEGFCNYLNPKFVQLLDVGTMPRRSALYRLYEAMLVDERIAGCCGEIAPRDASMWSLIESAQVVEYKFAHIFDKALESVFGYITVLPGAFSAYRWEALQGSPLDEYFHSVRRPHEMNCFKSNIYLAEDRVLCMALVFKRDNRYLLRYVKNSVAETDVPPNLGVLLAQRRRWINGSWFALLDSLQKWQIIFYGNNHGFCRRICFGLQMLYYVINVFFSYFLVGSFFLSFGLLLRNQFPESVDSNDELDDMFTLGDTLLKLYFTCLIVVFILSLGAPPKGVEEIYKMISTIFAFFMFASIYFFVKFVLTEEFSTPVLMSAGITLCAFTVLPILHCTLFSLLQRMAHYLLITPTYINIFLIYAMCNLNDCSWGNRPDKMSVEEIKKADEFAKFRTVWVTVWAILNAGVGYTLTLFDFTGTDDVDSPGYYYIYIIGLFGVSIILIRFIGGLLYWFIETFIKKSKFSSSYDDENEEYDEANDDEIRPEAISGARNIELDAKREVDIQARS